MNDASTGLPVTQIDHTVVRGVIAYTSKKPERLDQERGREFFTITKYGWGGRTIGVHTEIDDRPSVMRDATYTVDENWMPQDCFVRLTVGDKFMGTGWFKFHDDYTECETYTALEGRVSQRMDHKHGPLKSFQNHAIACDSWHFFPLRPEQRSRPAKHRRVAAVLARPQRCDRPDALPPASGPGVCG